MDEITVPTPEPIDEITAESFVDLRTAGLTPREIHRLQSLRDCLHWYPHLEYFTTEQWRRLLFMKWRYDRGDYVDDMPPMPDVATAASSKRRDTTKASRAVTARQ